LNASVDFLVTVVEEERVLRVKLDLALALRLSAHVVVVARLENVIILLLIVRNVRPLRGLNQTESPLKK
jgi:hypothetical protein